VRRLLREIDCREPPVRIEDALEHLNLHRSYYNLENPTFVGRIVHRAKLTLRKLINVVAAIDLRGLWLPDENEVILAEGLPKPRVKYTTAHEIGHKLNPHHHAFFAVGDTALTLDPYYHEILEQEAHFAAGELIFMGDLFTRHAKDYEVGFDAVRDLGKRFDNSLASTLRRYVHHSSNKPLAALIGAPIWNGEDRDKVRHFVRNQFFDQLFPGVTSAHLLGQIETLVSPRRGGPVGEGEMNLADLNGAMHEFHWSSFFNQHDMLTLVVYRAPVRAMVGYGH